MLTLLSLARSVPAQVVNPQIKYVSVAPSGVCAATGIDLLTPNGTLYTCASGTWTAVGSSSGVTSISAGTGISVNAATGAVTVTNSAPGASPAGSARCAQVYTTSATFGSACDGSTVLIGAQSAAAGGGSINGGWGSVAVDFEQQITSGLDNEAIGFNVAVLGVPSGDDNFLDATYIVAKTTADAHTWGGFVGGYRTITHQGTGTMDDMVGEYSQLRNTSTAVVTNAYNYWSRIQNTGGGTVTNGFLYYGVDLGGIATNPYYSWFDSRGVGRCKEDNHLDSVGQTICVVYNPQFTKYTPGAADYERIIYGQWSANVAQIGPEAGGTGTLRRFQALGKSFQMPTGSSDPTCSAAGDIGNTWVDTTSGVTTHIKFCVEVASTPTWVSVI